MASSISIAPETSVTFPVAPDHPLAPAQSLRRATPDDILGHSFFASVIDKHLSLSNLPATALETERFSLATQLANSVGVILRLDFQDIIVSRDQTISFNTIWQEINANDVLIEDGGRIVIHSKFSGIPPILNLTCNTFAGS